MTHQFHFSKNDEMECVLPPGEYYIGDICYVLEQEIYDLWCDNPYTQFANGNGKYTLDYKGQKGVFATHMTMYGDGSYEDQNGHVCLLSSPQVQERIDHRQYFWLFVLLEG